jgi:transglutaminase-like putative cysteine protease
MKRRHFLQSLSAVSASSIIPAALAQELAKPVPPMAPVAHSNGFAPNPSHGWRLFEVTTRVDLPATTSATRVWVPLPSLSGRDWVQSGGDVWQGNAQTMERVSDDHYGAQMLAAHWAAGVDAPTLSVTSRILTRDRAINLSQPMFVTPLSAQERALFTQPTQLIPLDGIVRDTARIATKGAKGDLAQARAIYHWIIENTARNPKTRGCGLGDIRSMLETGDLTGKCADLNALFVGLARASGIPARDVYGIRVADSRFGYKSLGKSGTITKAQHCRAEVWLADFGWVPVDPADVRKVVLEERPGLSLNDPLVIDAREALFGGWEMNWLAYNDAHDVKLPGSTHGPVPFLMYPQGETDAKRFDSLDADNFRYQITSREIV